MDCFGALPVRVLDQKERIVAPDLQDQRRSVQKMEKGGNLVMWEDYEPITIWSYVGLIWLIAAVVAMVSCLIWIAV